MKAWVRFAFVQLISLVATVVGWVLLIPFCLALKGNRKAIYSPVATLNGKPRAIDVWPWEPLNTVYGNPEDGVSGRYALVWNKAGMQVPYTPPGPAWLANRLAWSAYCWSAWRNSADNLKYVFARKGGPFYRWENKAKSFYFQAGYYPNGYPVLSLGKM